MNEYVNAAPERGPGGLPRRRFWLVALLWLPIGVAVTGVVRGYPRAARAVCGSLALATVVLSLVAGLLGPMGILVYALILSLPAWILYATLRLRTGKAT